MKKFKKFVIALVLALVLASCAPAQPVSAPATEIPATEAPFEVVEVQKEASVFFVYAYTKDIPRQFFEGSDVANERVSFTKKDGSWSQEELKPQIKDFGPLFRMYLYKPLESIYGDCGVNTVNHDNITTKVVVQPICETIPAESTVTLEFGIANCDRDYTGGLVCTATTNIGSLRYTLNKGMDKFQFTVDGSYNYLYEGWIRQALESLGFDPLPDEYFDAIVPGQNYVIPKDAAKEQ